MSTYKAFQVTGSRNFELVTRERRAPVVGEVRIAIESCGVCHTDVLTVEGLRADPSSPIVPGHEFVGVIEAIGDGVHAWHVGDRVGVGYLSAGAASAVSAVGGAKYPKKSSTGRSRSGRGTGSRCVAGATPHESPTRISTCSEPTGPSEHTAAPPVRHGDGARTGLLRASRWFSVWRSRGRSGPEAQLGDAGRAVRLRVPLVPRWALTVRSGDGSRP
jgi:hypothetical protein